MIKRPAITVSDAFDLLEANGFNVIETDAFTLTIEHGQAHTIENMLAFTDTGRDYLTMFGVHKNGRRWTVNE